MTTARQFIATEKELRLPGVLDDDELVVTAHRYKKVGPVVRFAVVLGDDDDGEPAAEVDVPCDQLAPLIVALHNVCKQAEQTEKDTA